MTESKNRYTDFRIPVPGQYQDVFSHFYFAENKSSEVITKTLVPSFQTILIINFGTIPYMHSKQNTRIEVEKCIVIGPIKQAFDYSLPPDAEILTVNFIDDAFYRFFGNACLAEHVPMEPDSLLNDGCFNLLWHQLNQLKDIPQRVNHILKFSDPYLVHRNRIAEQLSNFNDPNVSPIKAIANQNRQTERNTQLNHKKHFGYSAKELSRYQRFLKAIEFIQNYSSNPVKMEWAEVITQCGYYDQSQLIHDFKHYMNLTPAKYLKFQQDICNPMP